VALQLLHKAPHSLGTPGSPVAASPQAQRLAKAASEAAGLSISGWRRMWDVAVGGEAQFAVLAVKRSSRGPRCAQQGLRV